MTKRLGDASEVMRAQKGAKKKEAQAHEILHSFETETPRRRGHQRHAGEHRPTLPPSPQRWPGGLAAAPARQAGIPAPVATAGPTQKRGPPVFKLRVHQA